MTMNAPTRESVELAQREYRRELRNPASILILDEITGAYLVGLDAPVTDRTVRDLNAPDPLS